MAKKIIPTIITFDQPIFETIWTGDVDQILSVNIEKDAWTVMDVKTGRVRVHGTSLEIRNLSQDNKPNSRVGRAEVIDYVVSTGLPKYMMSDRLGLLKKKKIVKVAIAV